MGTLIKKTSCLKSGLQYTYEKSSEHTQITISTHNRVFNMRSNGPTIGEAKGDLSFQTQCQYSSPLQFGESIISYWVSMVTRTKLFMTRTKTHKRSGVEQLYTSPIKLKQHIVGLCYFALDERFCFLSPVKSLA